MDKAIGRRVEMIMLTSIPASIKMTRNMAMVNFLGALEVNIKVTMCKTSSKAMVRCIGQMDPSIVASGKKEFNAASVL